MPPQIKTLADKLFWSYANLAMAHAAVDDGAAEYGRVHFMVRAKLFRGLCKGTMSVGSLVEEDRVKMTLPKGCIYCRASQGLTLDHLIPKSRGGPETGDNIVWACRSCNSKKQGKDLLRWYAERGDFPPLLLLRRYLKLAMVLAASEGLLDIPLTEAPSSLPFALEEVPVSYPAPRHLKLWAE